jgi:hypothetical protein
VSKAFLYLFLMASAFSAAPVCAQSQNADIAAALRAANQAMAAADAVQARSLAPEEFRSAELALQQADVLAAKRKNREAGRQAQQARLYADLAAAKARYLQSKENVEQKTSDNQALRRELLLGPGGRPL